MSGIAIARGTVADVDAVMRIMDTAFDPAFGEAWNRAQLIGILALGDVWLDLATPEGTEAPEGFALARRTLDEAELLLLAVRPDARRRGIGEALVEAVAGEALAKGALRLLLEMRDGNPALSLYRRTGFSQIGRRRDYYRGKDRSLHDALTLARPLSRDHTED